MLFRNPTFLNNSETLNRNNKRNKYTTYIDIYHMEIYIHSTKKNGANLVIAELRHRLIKGGMET